jgi:hypothetical protein
MIYVTDMTVACLIICLNCIFLDENKSSMVSSSFKHQQSELLLLCIVALLASARSCVQKKSMLSRQIVLRLSYKIRTPSTYSAEE